MVQPVLEANQQPISLLFQDTREALEEALNSLRDGVRKQDLKLALALILSRDIQQGFTPDELREVGVKDVPKGVAEPIRRILLRHSLCVTLTCKRQKLCDGRVESRYYFATPDTESSNQIHLHF